MLYPDSRSKPRNKKTGCRKSDITSESEREPPGVDEALPGLQCIEKAFAKLGGSGFGSVRVVCSTKQIRT